MPEAIEYENYTIPAPPGMHPFEKIVLLTTTSCTITLPALPRGDKLQLPASCVTEFQEFDFNDLSPTDGSRVRSYMKLHEISEVLGDFRRYLSKKDLSESEDG